MSSTNWYAQWDLPPFAGNKFENKLRRFLANMGLFFVSIFSPFETPKKIKEEQTKNKNK